MLEELDLALRGLARVVAAPLFAVAPDIVDDGASWVRVEERAVSCRLVARMEACCPLELLLWPEGAGVRVNVFFGEGADFCVWEECDSGDDARGLAGDVEGFLRSRVTMERYATRDGRVFRRVYRPSEVRLDGRPMAFVATAGRAALLGRRRLADVVYEPWLV